MVISLLQTKTVLPLLSANSFAWLAIQLLPPLLIAAPYNKSRQMTRCKSVKLISTPSAHLRSALALQGAFVQITVKGPRFWCQEDEDKFFEWIYSLPNYQSVTGRGLDLIIELNEPVPQSTINQLFVLFKRWELDFNALAPLKNINKSHIAWVNEFFK
ncbi:hypothetical protein [Rheinheimera nanhaiensis]|uniref:hypothetical protein n=1 Tax=Rheinheimera nanhaiensis TaxID=1163621 RepID=UPI001ED9C3CD|nr:hypothetical protein [Rheinheimera nanhaiensis]